MRAALLATVMLFGSVAPVTAQHVGEFAEVSLVPTDGVTFSVGGRSYGGTLRVRALADGLSLVERVPLDGYLAGVREVPATWPEAALDVQAVAARTYLAWTLSRGRSTSASRYDFDICATTQCQVYVGGSGEPRWVDAVSRTAREILVYNGSPAQTMYFSTSGGYTVPIQDIFAGATPKPYLTGATSPDESSPFVTWKVVIPARAFVEILEAGGYNLGELESMRVNTEPAAAGVWHMAVETTDGTIRVPVSDVRRIFNSYGPELYPDELPDLRPDGRRYPQAILSYRFDVDFVPAPPLDATRLGIPADDRPVGGVVIFEGIGWGHHVGMSQYGALAMAEKGEDYDAILAHFYGGLVPTSDSDALPDVVSVGLSWGDDNYVVRASGPFQINAGGRLINVVSGGTWIFKMSEAGDVSVISGDLLLDRLLSRFSGLLPVS